MSSLYKVCFYLIFLLCTHHAIGQPWMDSTYLSKSHYRSGYPNFYDIQKAFNSYENEMDSLRNEGNRDVEAEEAEEGKFPGYNLFKRWEWFNQPRVYPSGEFPLVETELATYKKYLRDTKRLKQNHRGPRSTPATWQNLNTPIAPAGHMTAGVGRINCLTFMPGNNMILFAGASCGGVWKSLDGGMTWDVLNTDQLPSLSITSIVIDPVNTNNIYIATGDNFTGFPLSGVLKQGHYSAGIYKSNNGGLTWSLAGLLHSQADGFIPQQLILDPVTPSIMLLASNTGIWRTINNGTNWTLVNNGGFFYSIEFNPLNHNVVYATNGIGLYRSNNNGVSWTYKGGGYPNTLGGRVSLAVTPADTNYVYVWGPTAGFKKSVDGGNTLTTMTNPDNIAQPYGYIDRAIGVSNTNAMDVMVGGILVAKSSNGGSTWTAATDFQDITAPNWVHPDDKKIIYEPGSGSKLYVPNDGGVSISLDNGTTWTDISDGLQIAEIYKIANDTHDADTLYFGAQDIGTYRWVAADSSFHVLEGGDGFQPLVDPTITNTLFASYQIGNLRKSINNGETFFSASPGQYLWDPPIKMNPLNHNTMYAGCVGGVKKSIASGIQGTYINMSSNVLANIIAMDITKADTNYIYASSINQMIRSEDGGTNWTDITAGLPVANAAITYICASTTDPKKVFVSFSGYSATNKIFMSANGGLNWTNITGNLLPNVPVNSITYMDGSYDGVYIGTDFGVFYRDGLSADWMPFNDGLPNVIVNSLDIQYSALKIRAGTYGRGLWESDLATQISPVMTWVGSVSSNWNDPLNWNPKGVPIFNQDVIIPNVTAPAHFPIVNVTGLACKSLSVQPSSMVTILASKKLEVRG
ncbi:MAG: hypothetical protein IPP15_00075 [Saprospiraceae bacterium]|uniref:Sortilin N-terminal domain-containing protein n=1 Tax=Candidatus Opimibacter skivensis TaxID=2982028 RepID=A0A9D7XRK4_9BACT|nr:hypothetical protein [Candidatus Opimibacter skivensis]